MASFRIVRKKDRLREKLNEIVPGVNEAIDAANQTSATELADAIRKRAPVLTGEYKSSINAKPVDDNAARGDQVVRTTFSHTVRRGRYRGRRMRRNVRATGTLAWGIFALYIWRYLEFGTSKMSKQPHVMGTYRSMRKRIMSRMSRGIRKAVKAAAK